MKQDNIWNFFQNIDSANSFEASTPRYQFLAKNISPQMKVLNIGVGRGGLEEILLSIGANVSCLDPSKESIEFLRNKFGLGDRAQEGYSQSMPFSDNQFDVVIMSEVLEHLDDDILKDTLLEVRRVLRKKGKFIGTVPAKEVLSELRVACPNCNEVFHRWGHVQSFSIESLQDVLRLGGFCEILIEYRVFPDWSRVGLINYVKSIGRYILGRIGSPAALPSLYFYCINVK